MALADLNALGAFGAARDLSMKEGTVGLQNMGALQAILAKAREQQMVDKLRADLAQSGGDPEKALQLALQSGNVVAAHQLAPVIVAQQAVKSRQLLQGLTPEQLKDPEVLRRIGASGLPGTAHLTAEAERQQKLKDSAETFDQMQGPEVPVQREVVQGQPGPATDAALLKAMGGRPAGSPPMSITVSPDASQDPTLAPTARQGGIFDALTESKVPEIAAEAKALQKRLAESQNTPAMTAYFTARQKALADKEIGYATAQAGRQFTVDNRVVAPRAVDVIPEEHSHLNGDDYLATLPQGKRNTIKAVAEGRAPLTTFSVKNNERDAMLQMATQYDPTFSAAVAPARAATYKNFTAGPESRNVTALNTAIAHLGTMKKLGDALANGDLQAINSLANSMNMQLGKEAASNFGLAQTAVGDEMMRVFRQVGASEREAEDWRQKFNRANSPEQQKGALRTAAELLTGRIDALNDTYDRGMGTTGGFPKMLSDKSKAAMASFGVGEKAAETGATPKQRIRFDAQGNIISQ